MKKQTVSAIAKQANRRDKVRGSAGEEPPPSRPRNDELELKLTEVNIKNWSARSKKERIAYLSTVEKFYFAIVDEFLKSSNLCVERHRIYNERHTNWRWLLILATGVLALLNLYAAWDPPPNFPLPHDRQILSLVAAAYAASLIVLGNLEAFSKSLERAQAYRQARELFLNANRQYEQHWHSYVRPFGDSASACVNASKLHEMLVSKDVEVRETVKESTDIESSKEK